MIDLAIGILWLLIGLIILLGVVWLAKLFVAVPTLYVVKIETAIEAIVLILCLIYALSLLGGRFGGVGLVR